MNLVIKKTGVEHSFTEIYIYHTGCYEHLRCIEIDLIVLLSFKMIIKKFFPTKCCGEGSVLGCIAIWRQPVARAKQASIPWPSSKNQFNI